MGAVILEGCRHYWRQAAKAEKEQGFFSCQSELPAAVSHWPGPAGCQVAVETGDGSV